MANDGFGTLSAGLMDRDSERVRAVLDETNPEASSISVDMTFTPTRGAKPDDPKWLATQVPTVEQKGSFEPVSAANGAEPTALDISDTTELVSDPPVAEKRGLTKKNGKQNQAASPPLANEDQINGHAPAKSSGSADTDEAPRQNPVSGKHTETTERRAGSGASLTITQPKAGDMSQVTISIENAPPMDPTPQKGGQRASSITYERREATASEQDVEANDGTPVWIETPNYSGPDRRHKQVSPEVERRKTVPPRIKVGVRLEQERYLRLKLASVQSGRTQQDLVTSALDTYFDELGFDRFVRIAMGFGVSSDGSQLDEAS